MLYGSPSETDARLRMAPDQRMMELAQRVPPLPLAGIRRPVIDDTGNNQPTRWSAQHLNALP